MVGPRPAHDRIDDGQTSRSGNPGRPDQGLQDALVVIPIFILVVLLELSLRRRRIAGCLLPAGRGKDLPEVTVNVAAHKRAGAVVVLFPVLSVRDLAPRRS